MIFQQIDGHFSLNGKFYFNGIGEMFTTNLQHIEQIYNTYNKFTTNLQHVQQIYNMFTTNLQHNHHSPKTINI